MNIMSLLPATEAELVAANPRVLPDAVRWKLLSWQRKGAIETYKGQWRKVRKQADEYLRPTVPKEPKGPETATCPSCQQEFVKRDRGQRFCCTACVGMSRRKWRPAVIEGPSRVCASCGVEKRITSFQLMRGKYRKRTCSGCYKQRRVLRNVPKRIKSPYARRQIMDAMEAA